MACYCLFSFLFSVLRLISFFFLARGCDFLFSLSFLVYFLYVVCECVPSIIFPVQRTTSGVGDRPNWHNVRTTTTTTTLLQVNVNRA